MYRNKKISVYFPCRNEENHLDTVLKKCPKFVDEIIVVSNCSTDKTFEKAKKLKAKAYKDDRKLNGIGYGYASITGIKKATGDIIISADGDGTYPIEDLGSILDYYIDNKLDFLSCNRYPLLNGVKIPLMLQIGVNILNLEVALLYKFKIKDILSGMWVINGKIKNKLKLSAGDWNLSPQIKINAFSNNDIRCDEYNIVQHARYGNSKQKYFKTGWSHLSWIFKNRFSSS